MNLQKQALLHALEIPIWLQRSRNEKESLTPTGRGPTGGWVPEEGGLSFSHDVDSLQKGGSHKGLPLLRQCVADCQLCPLHKTRTQTVFGVGNEKAKLMIIGEAPGFHEDQQGEPFVGRAGQLLNAMLNSIGLERSDIYIANILKCRPPNNRDPLPEEVAQCTPHLKQQIALIQPTVLCAVGRIAAQFLLDTTLSLSKLRGKVHTYGESKLPIILLIYYELPAQKQKLIKICNICSNL